MKIEEVSPAIYKLAGETESVLATRNLTPGIRFYQEPVYTVGGVEYRGWNPTRSKLAAAILLGLEGLPIKPGSRVLYLGAASGTTISHVSDIVGEGGHIWGVEFSPRPLRDFLEKVSKHRVNTSIILGDASKPEEYFGLVPMVDVVYCDVAQRNQAEILAINAGLFLKEGGTAMLCVKARSIDTAQDPSVVISREAETLAGYGFSIIFAKRLEPYEKDHALIVATYSGA